MVKNISLLPVSLDLAVKSIEMANVITNFTDDEVVDKKVNLKVISILKNLNIYITNEDEFINYSTIDNTYFILTSSFYYRNLLNLKWISYIIKDDGYKKSINEIFTKAFFDYFYIHVVKKIESLTDKKVNILEYVDEDRIDNLENINIILYNLKVKLYYDKIIVNFITDKDEFSKIVLNSIINTERRIFDYFNLILYLFNIVKKEVEIDVEKIVDKKNRIFLLNLIHLSRNIKIKIKNLSVDTAISYIIYYFTGKIFEELKFARKMRKLDKIFLDIEDEIFLLSLLDKAYNEDMLKLVKKNRKFFEKILSKLKYERYLDNFEKLKNVYYLVFFRKK